jgi:hypothetical protein
MWKWTEQLDTAFEIPTYRVKVDGYIIGSVKKFGKEWSWEVGFALLKMPEGCTGTRPTKEEARQAVEARFNKLTAGMSKNEAYDRMMKGLRARRHRAT